MVRLYSVEGSMELKLSEEQILDLCFCPLYIFYLVAGAHEDPKKLTQIQLIKAMEYGLSSSNPFSEALFDFLKSNLHKFHERLPQEFDQDYRSQYEAHLSATAETLATLKIGDLRIYSYKKALCNLARFVADGKIFGKNFQGSEPMNEAARKVDLIFA